MIPAVQSPALADRLPPVRGRVQAHAPLAPFTWFRVGGPAEALVRPSSAADLAAFLSALPHDVTVQVLGAASNVIVRDGGMSGVVLRLGRGFGEVCVEPDGVVARPACSRAPVAQPAPAADIRRSREDTQPVRARTGGATFRNPPGMRAWELIDAAGGRGLTRGAAMCSDKHCNFLLNTGGATAADLEGLGEELRRRVHAASGVTLEWEIKRMGIPSGPAPWGTA